KSGDARHQVIEEKGLGKTPPVKRRQPLFGKTGADKEPPPRPGAEKNGRNGQNGQKKREYGGKGRKGRHRSLRNGILDHLRHQVPLLLPEPLEFRKQSKTVLGRRQPQKQHGGADDQSGQNHIGSRYGGRTIKRPHRHPRRRGKKDPENPQRVKQDQGESAEHRGREKGGGPGMSNRIQEERKRQKPDRHKGKGSEERGDQHRENATE